MLFNDDERPSGSTEAILRQTFITEDERVAAAPVDPAEEVSRRSNPHEKAVWRSMAAKKASRELEASSRLSNKSNGVEN